MMSKKYHLSMLEEEAKDDQREERKRSKKSATNESTFKTPATNVTPTKRTNGGSNTSSGAKETLNTSASSAYQPQTMLQGSPGVDQRMQDLSIQQQKKR